MVESLRGFPILESITPHMEILMRGREVRDIRREDAIKRMEGQGTRWLYLKERYEETGYQEKFRIKTKGLKPGMSYIELLDLKIKRVEECLLNTSQNMGK